MSDEPPAISLKGVSKIYRLYGSLTEQALDVFGLSKLLFWRRPGYAEHWALKDINLEIRRGERVGILGRNGAGKTTLLKIITSNFLPTTGDVIVNGSVQALMGVGLGFHPEFTGHENIRSSLTYNGLSGRDLDVALTEVIKFVELGEFLHQPVKTYSLGMQARLMFAASTAIKPDILIIDEILGAGDAYFSAKSSHRMEKLTSTGCTLLLVSHSTQQVLQFCSRAIWLECGQIVMDGEALGVVKAYEEFTQRLEWQAARQSEYKSVLDDPELRTKILTDVLGSDRSATSMVGDADNGTVISRWAGEGGLKITAVEILDEEGRNVAVVRTGQRIAIVIEAEAECEGEYPCSFVVVLFTADGRVLSRHCGETMTLKLSTGQRVRCFLQYPAVLLGNGSYFFSAAIYKELDLRRLSSARFYDLLSRSFQFRVLDELADDPSLFHHPGTWSCS
jgi:lipopolysaccharide transport system ATP-binding protein